ncbi:rCG42232 [Rattus norvegicus]|uniref:RCG42232 n=1 Tax=Rattus norvegicus TaxID=10116 RepID=A6MGU5_RAT|nr:rCG42232 [Rattus norvegicus]
MASSSHFSPRKPIWRAVFS